MLKNNGLEEYWVDSIDLIKKLDRERWSSYKGESDLDNLIDLSASEKILTHWIIYITDRLTKVKNKNKTKGLWERALPIFSSWVKDYSRNGNINKIEMLHNAKDGFIYYIADSPKEQLFKSRYHNDDMKNIKRTLLILNDYDRNLLKFIATQIDRFRDKEDVIRRIACNLFILTYETKNDIDETKDLLADEKKFEEYYTKWRKSRTQNKKRLWAAFRDYLKHPKVRDYCTKAFRDMNRTDLVTLWEIFGKEFNYLNQLELPGDVWNQKPGFTKTFLAPLALILDIESLELKNVSQVARDVCDKLNDKYGLNIYPEMLDFTWEDKLREEFLKKSRDKKIKIEIR